MKKLYWILLFLFPVILFSQEKLYLSTQSGEMTQITGSGTASTIGEDDESGSCSCSKTGPILFNISPTSIGPDQQITVNGWVKPDKDNAPAGADYPASITCDCTWNWKKWVGNPDGEDYYEDKSDDTTGTREYVVVSIYLEIKAEINWDDCTWDLSVEDIHPEGAEDNVTWDNGETGATTSIAFDPDLIDTEEGATLTVGGVSYASTTTLTVDTEEDDDLDITIKITPYLQPQSNPPNSAVYWMLKLEATTSPAECDCYDKVTWDIRDSRNPSPNYSPNPNPMLGRTGSVQVSSRSRTGPFTVTVIFECDGASKSKTVSTPDFWSQFNRMYEDYMNNLGP